MSADEFPRRHHGPFFKVKAHAEKRGKGPTAKRRATKSRALKRHELDQMNEARTRDLVCRFPACGCGRSGLGWLMVKPEISHQDHRGMGGNPAGDRTAAARLVLVCNWRHKLSKFSIDQRAIRWVPLTQYGSDGPIAWQINANRLPTEIAAAARIRFEVGGDTWIELARETSKLRATPRTYEPFTDGQLLILGWLAAMTE